MAGPGVRAGIRAAVPASHQRLDPARDRLRAHGPGHLASRRWRPHERGEPVPPHQRAARRARALVHDPVPLRRALGARACRHRSPDRAPVASRPRHGHRGVRSVVPRAAHRRGGGRELERDAGHRLRASLRRDAVVPAGALGGHRRGDRGRVAVPHPADAPARAAVDPPARGRRPVPRHRAAGCRVRGRGARLGPRGDGPPDLRVSGWTADDRAGRGSRSTSSPASTVP